MTSNNQFALNTVFRVESFSKDAPVLRPDCFKTGEDAYILSAAKMYSPRSVLSGDISLMPIFVAVRW